MISLQQLAPQQSVLAGWNHRQVTGPAQPRAGVGGSVATSVLTSVVAGLLVLASLAGREVLAGAVFPLQAALVVGWLAALGVEAALGGAVIGLAAAAVADALMAAGPTDARRLVAVVSVGLLIAMAHQLLRRDGRPGLTASLTATVSVVALVCALAALPALRAAAGGNSAVRAALTAAAGAVLVAWLCDLVAPRPALSGVARRGWVGVVLGMAVAAGIGAGIGSARDDLGPGHGAILATAVAAVALAASIAVDLGRADLAGHPPPGRRRVGAGLLPLAVVLPITASAPVAYVTGRILLS